ncbi:MAG: hypothetical protein LKM40_06440 [Mageeibacillus sp.]|jgi:hypothetical protein|nr:hypothetical protein [Mageeibacillus sp.]
MSELIESKDPQITMSSGIDQKLVVSRTVPGNVSRLPRPLTDPKSGRDDGMSHGFTRYFRFMPAIIWGGSSDQKGRQAV